MPVIIFEIIDTTQYTIQINGRSDPPGNISGNGKIKLAVGTDLFCFINARSDSDD